MPPSPASTFERLVRALFAAHPAIRHEWRARSDALLGDRTDVVVAPRGEAQQDIWTSIHDPGRLAVGVGTQHEDFESFGRKLSDDEVQREAFEYFVTLLSEYGYLK